MKAAEEDETVECPCCCGVGHLDERCTLCGDRLRVARLTALLFRGGRVTEAYAEEERISSECRVKAKGESVGDWAKEAETRP